jgi:exonuclease SbcD
VAKRPPIRVIHTADLHIGMENYGRWNPATGLHGRLEDYLASLDQVVDFALAEDADVFLVAGDIYKTKDPTPTQQREFARRVKRLAGAGVQVVLLVGNHDMPNRHGDANPLDIYASLELPGVTIFRRPDLVTLETRKGPLQIAALPHLPRSFLMAREQTMPRSLQESERLLERVIDEVLEALASEVDPAVPALLTAHLSVDVATLGSERDLMLGKGLTVPLSALARKPYDYVAMGHIHKHQVLGDSPACVYPGSLDRIDFGEADDEKGFYVVDVARGRVAMKRVPITVRHFKTIRTDLTQAEDPTAALLEAVGREDVRHAVVRLAYTIQAERANAVDEGRVRAALAEAFDVVWRPDLVQGEARTRHPGLTEAIADKPLDALAKYLELKPELADQADFLMAKAAELLQDEVIA